MGAIYISNNMQLTKQSSERGSKVKCLISYGLLRPSGFRPEHPPLLSNVVGEFHWDSLRLAKASSSHSLSPSSLTPHLKHLYHNILHSEIDYSLPSYVESFLCLQCDSAYEAILFRKGFGVINSLDSHEGCC